MADVWTLETGDNSILSIGRYMKKEKIISVFNFNEDERTAWINEDDGIYKDILTGEKMEAKNIKLPGYGFRILIKKFK